MGRPDVRLLTPQSGQLVGKINPIGSHAGPGKVARYLKPVEHRLELAYKVGQDRKRLCKQDSEEGDMRVYVGIDVSKDSLDMGLLAGGTAGTRQIQRQCGWVREAGAVA